MKKIVYYEAIDGTRFASESECKMHEYKRAFFSAWYKNNPIHGVDSNCHTVDVEKLIAWLELNRDIVSEYFLEDTPGVKGNGR